MKQNWRTWKFKTAIFILLYFSISWFGSFKVEASASELYQTTPTYKHFSVEDGLPGSTIYCAEQDADGFMWFGTDAGVSRFDGKEFVNYGVKDGVSDSDVMRIFQDSKGRLWFLTLKGILSYYYKGKIYNPDNDPLLPKEPAFNGLMTMHEDCFGTLWFGGIGSQVVIVSELLGSRLINLDEAKLNQGVFGWAFLYEPDSINMWVSGMDAKYVINKKTLNFTSQPNNYPIDSITFLSQTGPFEGVLLNNNEVFFLKGGEVGKRIYNLSLDSRNHMFRAEIDSRKNFWIYENGQCWFFERENNLYKEPIEFFRGQSVNRVFIDKENNKWFCTSGNGVYLVSENQKWISNFIKEPEGNMVVLCAHNDRTGAIWFGTSDGQLGRISKGQFTSLDLNDKFGVRFRILSITSSLNNLIYCASDIGLIKINFRNGQYTQEIVTKDDLERFPTKFVACDRLGKMYCADYTGISYTFNRNGKEIRSSTLINIPHKRTYTIFFDSQNRLWYENFDELICWDGVSAKSYLRLKKYFGNKITSINQLDDSTIVIATNGNGVRFLKNDSVIGSLNTSNGLCSDVCRRIFRDKDFIYIATNNGISRFKWQNGKVFNLETFNTNDGLLSDDVHEIVTDKDNIYIATSKGLCIVDKRIIREVALPPVVKITSVIHRNKKIENFEELLFNYNESNFTVQFIGITFSNSEKVAYQFSTDGGRNWQDSKTGSIQFSEVPSGHYELFIRAKKYNSVWGKPAILEYDVSAPFYKSIWFFSVVFVVSILCIFFILRSVASRKYERELQSLRTLRELESERNRIASEMHDDFGADLTLIAIQARILKSQSGIAENHVFQIEKIASISSRLIDKMGEIIWALNTSNDTLINLISYIHKYGKDYLSANGIKCTVSLPHHCPNVVLNSVYRRNTFLIIKEAIHNIVKHSEASNVTITFEIDERSFKIIIFDDGIGMQNESRPGNGIINMHNRASDNKATLEILSSIGTKVIYTDIKIKLPAST